MQIVIAWIKKYIFHIKSPSARLFGYDYEWDLITKGSRMDIDMRGIRETGITAKEGMEIVKAFHDGLMEGFAESEE